ncbi:MAG: hypothetical protein U1F67_20225 [Rubrivivax sp.]
MQQAVGFFAAVALVEDAQLGHAHQQERCSRQARIGQQVGQARDEERAQRQAGDGVGLRLALQLRHLVGLGCELVAHALHDGVQRARQLAQLGPARRR